MDTRPIPAALRWALAGKALLLFALASGFGALALLMMFSPRPLWLQILGVHFFLALGLFLAGAAGRGLMDAVVGHALEGQGALALPSRRSGLSMQLPSGAYLEFILWNPWEPLRPGVPYKVSYGRYSRVLVRPPAPEI